MFRLHNTQCFQILALTNGSFVVAEAAQHLQWQGPVPTMGPRWRKQAQELLTGPMAARQSPQSQPQVQDGAWREGQAAHF